MEQLEFSFKNEEYWVTTEWRINIPPHEIWPGRILNVDTPEGRKSFIMIGMFPDGLRCRPIKEQ